MGCKKEHNVNMTINISQKLCGIMKCAITRDIPEGSLPKTLLIDSPSCVLCDRMLDVNRRTNEKGHRLQNDRS
jgi:hypothetical protein